jgi:tyrosyl-tRNA synthetase
LKKSTPFRKLVFLSVFEGVPQAKIARAEIEPGLSIVELLSSKTGFLKSNGEARRALTENSIQINKSKVTDSFTVNLTHLINNKYLILQRGKKNFFLVEVG